jgi:hypothetical protein
LQVRQQGAVAMRAGAERVLGSPGGGHDVAAGGGVRLTGAGGAFAHPALEIPLSGHVDCLSGGPPAPPAHAGGAATA